MICDTSSSNGWKSGGIYLDSNSSNGDWGQREKTATAMGESDEQQAVAATTAAIIAKAMMAERAAMEATAAKALTPERG